MGHGQMEHTVVGICCLGSYLLCFWVMWSQTENENKRRKGVEGRMREKLLINEIQAANHRENIAFKHWLETKNVCFFSV